MAFRKLLTFSRSGSSNSLLPSWDYYFVSQKFAQQPRRPWSKNRTSATTLWTGTRASKFQNGEDVGGQRCPESVRNYCAVSVGQNPVQIQNPDTRKPSRLKISDIDGQTPHNKSWQNPDSAVRRRLVLMSPEANLLRPVSYIFQCYDNSWSGNDGKG